MYRFLIDDAAALTPSRVGKILRKFQLEVAPALDFARGYYRGTGQAIMRRANPDPTRPNNRIVKNYCKTIVDNFAGYLTGNPIAYTSADGSDISAVQDLLDANDVVNEDSAFLTDALVHGVAYELCYVNEANEKRFKAVAPECVVPLWGSTLDEELLAAIYFYPLADWEDECAPTRYSVSLYTADTVTRWECDSSFSSFDLLDESSHYFGEVPFVVFELNRDCAPVFEPVISLQDAYNALLSDEVNDFQSFVDAYLVMKNVSATAEDLAKMKESRTILIDGEDDVSYLTKDISDTQIENMLANINASIHTVSNSPDFSSEEFNSGVSSGIALQFKLVGFNNLASSIEARFRKALQRRLSLLNRILYLTDTDTYAVDVTFSHNLPSSIADTVSMVNALRGLVSDETLLAQIPFISDVDAELARITAQDTRYLDPYAAKDVTPHDQETE